MFFKLTKRINILNSFYFVNVIREYKISTQIVPNCTCSKLEKDKNIKLRVH